MPNHCLSKLVIGGKSKPVQSVKQLLWGLNGLIDFNKVIRTPSDLQATKESTDNQAQIAKNIRKYGFGSWYDFQREKWGT
jgi:hypothetical protein